MRLGFAEWVPGFRYLAPLLIYGIIAAGVCSAETVEGVLYRETGGQGANPVRGIRLAVGNHVYYLEYAPRFLKLRVSRKSCWEPGSLWTVKLKKLENLAELTDATCAGKVDEQVHGAVVVVRDYLKALALEPATTVTANASSRWKASPSFMEYENIAHKLDLTSYNPGRFLVSKLSRNKLLAELSWELQIARFTSKTILRS